MANTKINTATIVASNSDPAPTGVVPSPTSCSDGKYTWACVGQKDLVGNSNITFRVVATASNPIIDPKSTNVASATCGVAATYSFVRLNVSFTSPSNAANWTLYIGSTNGGSVRFVRGNGGGRVSRTGTAKTVAKSAAKSSKKTARKPAKKAAAKSARKAAPKRSVKTAKKAGKKTAAKAAKKSASKTAHKARGK